MTEFVDRVNLEDLEFGDERPCRCNGAYTAPKLFGVAMLGAVAALAGYYIYTHLDAEKRNAVRECVISVASEHVRSLVNPDD